MAAKKDDGLKSAYELAMARMAAREEASKPLTDEQKAAIADVESATKAKIAEYEIMRDKRIAEARAKGDGGKIAEIMDQSRSDLGDLRAKADAEKARIRQAE